jgi:hypothetical protein
MQDSSRTTKESSSPATADSSDPLPPQPQWYRSLSVAERILIGKSWRNRIKLLTRSQRREWIKYSLECERAFREGKTIRIYRTWSRAQVQ